MICCGCLLTSNLNDKHSCQLFRMGLRDKTIPTLTTPLIRANMSCVAATIFSSLAFLSSSISMANLSRSVAASFSGLALLSSSISTANRSCLLVTTFSSLLSTPRFNLVVFCFLIFASYSLPFFPLSAVSEDLFALSFTISKGTVLFRPC